MHPDSLFYSEPIIFKYLTVAIVLGLDGSWLGFAGLSLGRGGTLFEGGTQDILILVIGIWILALCGVPGYFLWKWGGKEGVEQEN